jgi:hypothetical protein
MTAVFLACPEKVCTAPAFFKWEKPYPLPQGVGEGQRRSSAQDTVAGSGGPATRHTTHGTPLADRVTSAAILSVQLPGASASGAF